MQAIGPFDGSDPGVAWQADTADLTILADPGECVVYSERSGRTVYLEDAAKLVFDILRERPRSVATLTQALAERWQVDCDAIDVDALVRTLRGLEDTELVQRVGA